MDAVAHTDTRLLYPPIPTVVNSVGCSGACVYAWNGQNYNLQPGSSCTGAANCQQCPGSFGTDVRNLVLQMPKLFPDPDDISLSCGTSTSNQLTVAMIELFVDAIQNNTSQVLLTQTCKRYRNTTIGLGVLSVLLLGGLVYALFFR